MSNFFVVNNITNAHDKDRNVLLSQSQKLVRQNYKIPYKQTPQQISKQHVTSPNRFITTRGNDTLPPRAVPFRRSRNTSRENIQQNREQSDELQHIHKVKEIKRQSLTKISSLQNKLNQEIVQKEKWRSLYLTQEQKINNLTLQLSREKQQRQKMKIQVLKMKQELLEKERKLVKNNEIIQNLSKSLKEYKINQKSLANLKNIQNQLDLLQEKNSKLTEQNNQLLKSNRRIKNEFKKRDSTSESDMQVNKKCQKIQSLQLQIQRLRQERRKDRTQRQKILQQTLRILQKKLYEKQSQLKSMSIQLNFIDRKKYTSIDDVKTKKDQQIKDLKQKFLKVSRDLKQTKDKFDSNQKKRIPKSVRKIKSSKLLGTTSQSQENIDLFTRIDLQLQ